MHKIGFIEWVLWKRHPSGGLKGVCASGHDMFHCVHQVEALDQQDSESIKVLHAAPKRPGMRVSR